jgi:hypothetical protein
MKKKVSSNVEKMASDGLKALRRAAKKAVELARATGTHAYVLENGRIVDIAKRRTKRKTATVARHRETKE